MSICYFLSLTPQTSSAADLGQRSSVKRSGSIAGACAQGIWNFLTTKWLITASTPANKSIPCKVKKLRWNDKKNSRTTTPYCFSQNQ